MRASGEEKNVISDLKQIQDMPVAVLYLHAIFVQNSVFVRGCSIRLCIQRVPWTILYLDITL